MKNRKPTKYAIAKDKFIEEKMKEIGCGRRKACGLWNKSQERFNIVFEYELRQDHSHPTAFESNFLDPEDVGLS